MAGSGAFGDLGFGVGGFGSGNSETNSTVPVPRPLPSGLYPPTIWKAIKLALSYAQSNMDPANPQGSVAIAQATAQTLRNGVSALNGYQFYSSIQTSYANLAAIQALPVVLTSPVESALTNQIVTLQSAAAPVAAGMLLVYTLINAGKIAQGIPLVPDPQLIEWMMNFRYAPMPVGLTTSNFAAAAASFANAWQTLAQNLQTQAVAYTGASLAEVQLTYEAAAIAAYEVAQITLSPNVDILAAWNLLVILPTMTRVASLTSNDPTNVNSQLYAVQRYVALTLLQQFNNLLVSFNNNTQPEQIKLVAVRQGDNLMDIAARELGDYTQWSAIATANSLLPPYISTTAGPNVAIVGQLLFLPNGNASTNLVLPAPSYEAFFLGTDIYYGPLGFDMNPWNGDLPIISGYQNLALSLGRRLQTTLGTLIYHNKFGSRIPPEVGSITTSRTPSQISAYATSSLLSDPRVSSVQNVVVSSNLALGLITVACDVIPKGPGAQGPPIQVSTTITSPSGTSLV